LFTFIAKHSQFQVDAEERYSISRVPAKGNFFRILLRHGFKDGVITEEELGRVIHDPIRDFLNRNPDPNVACGLVHEIQGPSESPSAEANEFTDAWENRIVFVVGKEKLQVDAKGLFRQPLLGAFVWLNELSRSSVAEIDFPVDKTFEVGVVKKIQ
jgi:KUP system potassium uptake protein